MNLSNKLTLSRIFATPILIVLLFKNNIYLNSLALLIFIIASLTDLYDGQAARRRKEVSEWGVLWDPIADKILISTVFISLVGVDKMQAWMAILIRGREFIITGLRLLGIKERKILTVSKLGKWKTTSQMVAIIYTLFVMVMRSSLILNKISYLLMFMATVLTVISGIEYILKNKGVITHLYES